MDSENIQFQPNGAHYDDGGTGIDRNTIEQMVFGGEKSTAAVELNNAARGATSLEDDADDDGILRLNVTGIRLSEADESCLNVILETPDLSATLSADNNKHSRMVYRGDEYAHYQLGIEGTKR